MSFNKNLAKPEAIYTEIDLNSTGVTTVYDADDKAIVQGVFMANSGSSAEYRLEATDGTNTAELAGANAPKGISAGDALEFEHTMMCTTDTDLQINVTTKEGSALTETCVVFRTE